MMIRYILPFRQKEEAMCLGSETARIISEINTLHAYHCKAAKTNPRACMNHPRRLLWQCDKEKAELSRSIERRRAIVQKKAKQKARRAQQKAKKRAKRR
jgi:hypothetical protein